MMNGEKRFIWSLTVSWLTFGALLLLAVQTGLAQSTSDVYRTEEFNVTGNVSLEVLTAGGSIKAIGSNDDKVRVEMYVRKRNRYIEPGEADLSKYDIEITQSGNNINASAKRSGNNWNNRDSYSISFVVYTPNETRTRLRTSGGSVSASNLTGTQELRTSGGSVSTEGINGDMVLRTSGGSISIIDVQGDVEANTSGGTIRVRHLTGNLDARTSGGSIRLEQVAGSVEARTSGGSINAEVISPADMIDLRTSGGSITIKVPKENGYDLDLDANRVYAELVNFNGRAEKDRIVGDFNGGGTQIKAKTSGGSVRIEYL
ncbi:MAG: DUF4097 family beta strand repeat-containing protein [Gracilimonas sp.]|nr:DUF4097 family beta strand repeat-containing protein [Gracilimonas sp.]